MLCKNCLRSVIVQAAHVASFAKTRVPLRNTGRGLYAGLGLTNWWNREYRNTLRMMVDTGATTNQGPITASLPQRDDDSGGWKRL